MQEIYNFLRENREYQLGSDHNNGFDLFSNFNDDEKSKHAEELIRLLATNIEQSDRVNFKDLIKFQVRCVQRKTTSMWTDVVSEGNFGSKGNASIANTLIRLVFMDYFLSNRGHSDSNNKEFSPICFIDEIAEVDSSNRAGVMNFAKARDIKLILACPITTDGHLYEASYLVHKSKDENDLISYTMITESNINNLRDYEG